MKRNKAGRPKSAVKQSKQVMIYLNETEHNALRELSEKTMVPVSAMLHAVVREFIAAQKTSISELIEIALGKTRKTA